MTTISFRITFHHRDAGTPEEQWFKDAHSAWEAFRLFAEPDSSDIYTRVDLSVVNWEDHQDCLLAALEFPA